MTRQEYEWYEAAVAEFFSHGLENLSRLETCHEPFFSGRACQCCKTTLGGDRYECNGYNGQTDEVEEYDCICDDCVYYAEYGQLDDMTMSSLNDEEDD